MTTSEVRAAWEAVARAKADLLAAQRACGPEPVDDWPLRTAGGEAVRLSGLFGDHDDLLVVHNMGRGCAYCTLWADGFRGLADHLGRRTAFALCSADEPADLAAFAAARGWPFPCVSGAGSGFARAMGFEDDDGRPQPGVSSFHRTPVGTILRIAASPFGPGDDFCAVWPLLDLLRDGPGGFVPQ